MLKTKTEKSETLASKLAEIAAGPRFDQALAACREWDQAHPDRYDTFPPLTPGRLLGYLKVRALGASVQEAEWAGLRAPIAAIVEEKLSPALADLARYIEAHPGCLSEILPAITGRTFLVFALIASQRGDWKQACYRLCHQTGDGPRRCWEWLFQEPAPAEEAR